MVALQHGGRLQIGRGQSCTVRIEEPGISRIHAVLHLGQQLAVEDLGSSNGTRLRGAKLAAHSITAIQPGDTFEMGGALLTVQERAAAHVAEGTDGMPGPSSPAIDAVLAEAARLARGTINLLVVGETGVGKGRTGSAFAPTFATRIASFSASELRRADRIARGE